MITYVKGSLFESPAKVLVNTVNIVGVMGKGVAKTFKEIYPEMFSRYQELCENKQLEIGKLWLHKTDHKWILNFPTKIHWRNPSKPEYIEAGLVKFTSIYSDIGITSVAFPQLGCGNGELDWENTVRPIMEKYLSNLPIDIFIYEYDRRSLVPEHRDIETMNTWLRNKPRDLAFTEMWTDLANLINEGMKLKTWDERHDFKVTLQKEPEPGIIFNIKEQGFWKRFSQPLLNFLPGKIKLRINSQLGLVFVPQEALLDLWQQIRAYGFCVPRMMPEGLDLLASHIMPIMARLSYMKPVELASSDEKQVPRETGLRFFAPPISSGSSPKHTSYLVQPA